MHVYVKGAKTFVFTLVERNGILLTATVCDVQHRLAFIGCMDKCFTDHPHLHASLYAAVFVESETVQDLYLPPLLFIKFLCPLL